MSAPARRRKPTRAKALGVTDEVYAQLLERQGGGCAICRKAPKEGGRRLDVDHDHATGAVRGLLCWTCNHFILGKYATPAKLLAAARYLGASRADFLEHAPVDVDDELERERAVADHLFPPGCTCGSYGRGLTMTRVLSTSCPVHADST